MLFVFQTKCGYCDGVDGTTDQKKRINSKEKKRNLPINKLVLMVSFLLIKIRGNPWMRFVVVCCSVRIKTHWWPHLKKKKKAKHYISLVPVYRKRRKIKTRFGCF